VPIFTWTGCYIGGHVGGGFGRKDFSDTPTHGFVGGTSAPQSIQEDTSGFLGGGQVGCDYQFAPNWLVGIQGSGSGADIKGDVLDPFFTYAKHFRARTDWLANVTGRIGWTWDRWMIYGKGGVAWAGDKYDGDEPGFIFYASERRTGFVVGVGLEWAFWNNWSAFLEYDFYGFGTRTVEYVICGSTCNFNNPHTLTDIKQDINVVKFGINYRFNWGKAPIGKGPVVAKY